jgi:Helicase HerA, central domain
MSIKQDAALIELEQLKRHCAFLGASGSGKTSLALNLIEQAAQRGIGVIVLDRKGDLATFADPQCWERLDPDARRAKRKRELFDRLHVRLYTPGHAEGPSLSIRAVPPGLAELPQPERSHLARFAAQGLGSMMGMHSTHADLALLAILAKTIEVIGQLSSRRDLGLRDLIELLANEDESLIAELGRLDLKLCKKLINALEVLRINHGSLLESSGPALSAPALLGRDGSVPKDKVPLTIISTKFLGGPQRVDFWVSQLLAELSRWCSRSPAEKLQSLLFLDEADAYLPAIGKPATKEPLMDLLKRARSAGLGVMLATQSPGDLDYKARDNIGTWWVGRIGSPTAIEKMKPLLADCRIDVSGSLATSGTGEFFQISEGHAVRIRSDRSLMDTVQLNEERIVALAQALAPRVRVVA